MTTTIEPGDYFATLETTIDSGTLRVTLTGDGEHMTVATAAVPPDMPDELRPMLVEMTHAVCLQAYRSLYARHDLAYIGTVMQVALRRAQEGGAA